MAVHELYAYLRVRDAVAAIEFYKTAFGAEEKYRLVDPSGRIGHAELLPGGTTLMVSDAFPDFGIHAPEKNPRSPVTIHLHVDDADAVVARADEAGATLVRPLTDHFYGERSGTVRDPFGTDWLIGHSLEELTPEEMQRRYDEVAAS